MAIVIVSCALVMVATLKVLRAAYTNSITLAAANLKTRTATFKKPMYLHHVLKLRPVSRPPLTLALLIAFSVYEELLNKAVRSYAACKCAPAYILLRRSESKHARLL